MRVTSTLILTLLLAGLSTLAVWPHWPTLEHNARTLYTAWQQLRAEPQQPAAVTIAATETLEAKSEPRPQLVRPNTRATAPAANTEPLDPFIEEVNQRAKLDPAAAMEWLKSDVSGSDRLRGMLAVVGIWAADDSEAALLWLESNAQGLARLESLRSGVELWSQQDPVATAAWINGMANDGSKVTATQALAGNWAAQDPQAAADWVAGLPADTSRTAAARAIIDAWSTQDPEAAVIWALGETEATGDSELLMHSIGRFTEQDYPAAERFLRDISGSYSTDSLVSRYVETLAQSDPSAAVNWLDTLSTNDPLYTDDLARVALKEWSRSDSVAASTWLSEQGKGPERDAAIVGFAATMIDFEPEAALEWSLTISEPSVRMEQVRDSVRTWAKRHPADASTWLQQAELEPDLRASLAAEMDAFSN